MTNSCNQHHASEQNSYRQCIYKPYEQCIWDNVSPCSMCPISDDVSGYSLSPRPVPLRYELTCYSGLHYEDEIDKWHENNPEQLYWNEGFNKIYSNFKSWLYGTYELKRINSSYNAALNIVLANCLVAANSRNQILHPKITESSIRRNPLNIGYKVIQRAFEYLTAKNLVYAMNGVADPTQRAATWYVPSARLIPRLEAYQVQPRLNPKTLLLDYKTYLPKTKKWNIAKLPNELTELATKLQLSAQAFATLWQGNTATLNNIELHPMLWRVFNGNLQNGGRFYGSYQNLTRKQRELIKINGEETVEPDFTAIHLFILYSLHGLQFEGDPYKIEGFERETIKSALLRMLNFESRPRFVAQVSRSGNPDVKQKYENYLISKERCQQSGVKPNDKPNILKGFIEDMPDNQSGEELLSAIEGAHTQVSSSFFKSGLGLELQFIDSQIMSAIISDLAYKGIPVLPVHDSVRCRVSDLEIVKEVMLAAYFETTNYNAEIA